MSSLSIAETIDILRTTLKLPPETLVKIETELEQAAADKKADAADAPPKPKQQLVVVLIDPEGKVAASGDYVAHVVSLKEDDDAGTIPERLYKAAYAQNSKPGGRKRHQIKTLGDAGHLKKKVLTEVALTSIKTKEPVRVIALPNEIPVA
jgi:hypothetical protein